MLILVDQGTYLEVLLLHELLLYGPVVPVEEVLAHI